MLEGQPALFKGIYSDVSPLKETSNWYSITNDMQLFAPTINSSVSVIVFSFYLVWLCLFGYLIFFSFCLPLCLSVSLPVSFFLFLFVVVSVYSIKETSIGRRRDQISDYRLSVLIEMVAESSGQSRITKRGKLPINDVRWPQILTCVDNDLRLLSVQQSNSTLQSNRIYSTSTDLSYQSDIQVQVQVQTPACL